MQILVNSLIDFSLWSLIAISFSIKYSVFKFFDFSHVLMISFGGYLFYYFFQLLNLNLIPSFFLTLVLSLLLSYSMLYIFFLFIKRKIENWKLLVVSLGVFIVGLNTILLVFGNELLSISKITPIIYSFGNSNYSSFQLFFFICSITIILLILVLLKFTFLGKKIRAISSNQNLYSIFGFSKDLILHASYIISSVIAIIIGVLYSIENSFDPYIHFNHFLYAVVIVIIGGKNNLKGIILTALFISILNNYISSIVNNTWTDLILFFTLIIFLIIKPSGFENKLIKKQTV